ncbi:MAG: hypothetical protein R6U50_06915 [Desulfobacterales bacterium]
MKKIVASASRATVLLLFLPLLWLPDLAGAWYDETHIAIAKAAGYKKWYNAAAADLVKVKAGRRESLNHYSANPHDRVITTEMVFEQAEKYDKLTFSGHLYGAILGSLRTYIEEASRGEYPENHMAFCAHYIGDLSQPLHNTEYNAYNKRCHSLTDGRINADVLKHLDKIAIYPISLDSEKDVAAHIARIANLSIRKGAELENENRLISKAEAYRQIGHSASLLKAVIHYAEKKTTAARKNKR